MPDARSEKRSFEDFLDRPSEASLKMMRKGFALFGRLSKSQITAVVNVAVATMEDAHAVDKLGATDTLGLSESETFPTVVAASFLGRAINSRESLGEITEILRKRFDLGEKDVAGINTVLAEFQLRRTEIEETTERQALANAILPSFEHLRTTVDLRLKLVDDSVYTVAAVAVAHLQTDDEHQRVFFQLSKEQLKRLIDESQGTLKEMDEKEEWIRRHSKGH